MAGLRLRKVMQYRTDDLRIKEIKELLPPAKLLGDFPISEKAAQTVYETRQEIHRILHGADDRLVLILVRVRFTIPKQPKSTRRV